MRRKHFMMLGAAALVPVVLMATTASASAASGSLTVTTYDRTGAKVSTPLTVVGVDSNTRYDATSGKAKSLPKGKYVVLAGIHTGKTGSDTAGAVVVTVSGKKTATIDARQGKPLKYSLDKTPNELPWVQAHLCTAGTSQGVDITNNPGQVFVIPNSSSHLRSHFAYTWNTGTNEQWIVAYSQKTIPTTLTRTVKRSSLATLTTYARKGAAGSPDIQVTVQGVGETCRTGLSTGLQRANAPFALTTHISAGKWEIAAESIGSDQNPSSRWSTPRTFAAGQGYSQTFFRSAWGPGTERPQLTPGRITFGTASMFTDPGFGWSGKYGYEIGQKSTVTLSRGGTLVKKQNRSDSGSFDNAWFEASTKKKGWYLLKVSAERTRAKYNPKLLSARSSVWFSFYANPNGERTVPVALPRLSVGGLNGSNTAKARSATTVDITAQGTAATAMSAKASFDGGKTWKSVPVKKSGSVWKATVKNQGAGFVALRAQARTSKGYKTEVTIYRAYAVV